MLAPVQATGGWWDRLGAKPGKTKRLSKASSERRAFHVLTNGANEERVRDERRRLPPQPDLGWGRRPRKLVDASDARGVGASWDAASDVGGERSPRSPPSERLRHSADVASGGAVQCGALYSQSWYDENSVGEEFSDAIRRRAEAIESTQQARAAATAQRVLTRIDERMERFANMR